MDFLSGNAVDVAKQLLGWRFYRQIGQKQVGGVITETEAYIQEDTASHSYHGMTKRNAVMFGPAGHVYVYFTYGLHHCVNIVTGTIGQGEAVLLRSLLPDSGIEYMRSYRNNQPDSHLTDGPAKICQALGISLTDNGALLNNGSFLLLPPDRSINVLPARTRIGIRRNQDKLWRFSAEVSNPKSGQF